jgi:hypothetical protein
MSLPSGLIFFLDFTFSGDTTPRLAQAADTSVYGGGRVASEITGGVLLTNENAELGPYALNNGYASPTGSITAAVTLVASGTVGAGGIPDTSTVGGGATAGYDVNRLLRFDPDLVSGAVFAVGTLDRSDLESAEVNLEDLVAISVTASYFNSNTIHVRRLTREDFTDDSKILVAAVSTTASTTAAQIQELGEAVEDLVGFQAPLADKFDDGGALGSVLGASEWGLEGQEDIPEIDIKVDSRPSGHQSWVKTSTLTTTLTPRLSLHRSSLSRLLLRSIVRSLRILSSLLQLVFVTGPVTQVSSSIVRQVLYLL